MWTICAAFLSVSALGSDAVTGGRPRRLTKPGGLGDAAAREAGHRTRPRRLLFRDGIVEVAAGVGNAQLVRPLDAVNDLFEQRLDAKQRRAPRGVGRGAGRVRRVLAHVGRREVAPAGPHSP
jgi:hypothetical protein